VCVSAIFVNMKVTTTLTDHLAHLSRLHFSDIEKEEIRKDLEKMVGFVETLAQLNTDGIEPAMHLKNASGTNTSFFQVPKVIRK
jgi:aspartyl-tRNA(Asn)/glutamyl-tRNA(Gln) amidotransferase subunit C